jgi:hypothetical protein
MFKPLLVAALLAVAATLPQIADAALVSRSMLIQACTAHDEQRLNNCAGYITGIADTVDSVKDRVCIPQGLKIGLLRKGVSNYLQSHNTSDGPAMPSVLDAMRHLYPCNG